MSENKVNVVTSEDYSVFVTRLGSPLSMVDFNSKLATAGLGLGGEAGEIAAIVSAASLNYSISSSTNPPFEESTRLKLIDELGDIMWYVAFAAANVVSVPLRELYPNSLEQFGQLTPEEKATNLKDYYIYLAYRCGLFADTAKKLLFHGKPYTADQRDKLITQLRDILYNVNMIGVFVCDVQLEDIIRKNVEKLSARYQTLQFTTKEFMEKEEGKRV